MGPVAGPQGPLSSALSPESRPERDRGHERRAGRLHTVQRRPCCRWRGVARGWAAGRRGGARKRMEPAAWPGAGPLGTELPGGRAGLERSPLPARGRASQSALCPEPFEGEGPRERVGFDLPRVPCVCRSRSAAAVLQVRRGLHVRREGRHVLHPPQRAPPEAEAAEGPCGGILGISPIPRSLT